MDYITTTFYTYVNGPYRSAVIIVFVTLLFYRFIARSVLKQLKMVLVTGDSRSAAYITKILEKPLRLFFLLCGIYIAWQIAPFDEEMTNNGSKLITSLILYAVFWAMYRSVPYVASSLYAMRDTFGAKLTDGMVNFFARFARLLIIFLAIMSIMQKWQVNVISFLTAFGLGGMAVSLAARRVLENYFGTLSIFMDRTFSRGDHIRVNQVEGIVQFIGVRSTRLKLPEGGIAIIPNSDVVNTAVLNYSSDYVPEDEFNIGRIGETKPEERED